MNIPFIDAIIRVIDKVIPDPQAKAALQLEVLKLQQTSEFKQIDADLQVMLAQTEVNKIEAQSPSPYKSGWRPFLGWVGGVGFAYLVLIRPTLPWLLRVLGVPNVPDLPEIDTEAVFGLVSILLGVGGMRSFERVKGKA